MTSYRSPKDRCPEARYVSRALACSGGLSRIVVLESWYWDKLEILLAVDTPRERDIARFCQHLAERAVVEEGWRFEDAFQELLMYYIYRNYLGYLQVEHGIANDIGEDCFAS